jgi:hypothetical protein
VPWRGLGCFGPLSTRSHVVEVDRHEFGEAYALFGRLEPELDSALASSPEIHKRARCYFEFLGEHSFAGLHRAGEPKRLVLLDVAFEADDGVRFMGPHTFLATFERSGVELPPVVFRGKFGGKAFEAVEKLPPGSEGIVFKGGTSGNTWAAKVKTKAWEQRLKDTFKDGKWKAADAIERDVSEDSR